MPQHMADPTVGPPPNGARMTQSLSSPINLHGVDISSFDARDTQAGTLASLTPLPLSPEERERESSNSFFGDRGGPPSIGRIGDDISAATASMDLSGENQRSRSASVAWTPLQRKTPGSSPARSEDQGGRRSGDVLSPSHMFTPYSQGDSGPQSINEPTSSSTTAFTSSTAAVPPFTRDTRPAQADNKKATKKLLQVIPRSKSLRAEDEMKRYKKGGAKKPNGQLQHTASESSSSRFNPPPPLEKDRSFRDMMKTSLRDRSEDRLAESEDDKPNKTKHKKEKKENKDKQTKDGRERPWKDIREKQPHPKPGHPLSSSLRQHNTSTFFNDFRHSSSNAAIGLGKAGKGLFSKFSRSGSSSEKATVPVEDHIPGVLTLPLIQQTRITRIAKSYDHCKDKTEFWMPALPWRCIDYLNGKCEEEGLYRVSGGLLKVKEWRKRFDTELDVNLLDESDLYDASIIASLFKEWIRELPEEIFPKDAQDRITAQLPRELPEKGTVSHLLRDELQHLPPFHYYLLFAITCHLSLLLSYESKNKMTLDNLYRCFNQSLRLDGRIFYTLVGDWRQCWAGCLTENEFLRAEYDYLQHPYPQFIRESDECLAAQSNERAVSSSGSSDPPAAGISTPDPQRPATSHTQPSHSAEEGEDFWLSPVRKSHRSSSDVTGLSPMRSSFNATPRGSS